MLMACVPRGAGTPWVFETVPLLTRNYHKLAVPAPSEIRNCHKLPVPAPSEIRAPCRDMTCHVMT